jgi:cytochrome c peroxidase
MCHVPTVGFTSKRRRPIVLVGLFCVLILGCEKGTDSDSSSEVEPDDVVVEFSDDFSDDFSAGSEPGVTSETETMMTQDDSAFEIASESKIADTEDDSTTESTGEAEMTGEDGDEDGDDDGDDDGAAQEPAVKRATSASDPTDVVLGSAELFAGIPGDGDLKHEQIQVWLDDPANHASLPVKLPLGMAAAGAAVKGVEANPITRAKIELGRQLYFDTRLSSDNTISCASCHHPDDGFARKTQFGEGIQGQTGDRNSPVSFNRIVSDLQFWDGRAASLEEQAKGPIENPIEMGNTHANAVATVKGIDGYTMQFDKIFPQEGITIDTIAKAIATFERAVVTGPAPYDYLELVRNLENQLDEEELEELEEDDPELYLQYKMAKDQIADLPESVVRGRELFFSEKANCTACHAGANFSDEQYHNLGVGMEVDDPNLGRFKITGEEKDKGAFKTPTVRNISMTAPYMHDGSQQTLMEVVDWYDKGGHANPHLSDKIKKLALTDQEKQDLVAFMEQGLYGPFASMETERLPN